MNQLEDSTQKPSDLSIAGELANADTRFRPDLPSVYRVVVHVCSCVHRGVCKGVCVCVCMVTGANLCQNYLYAICLVL